MAPDPAHVPTAAPPAHNGIAAESAVLLPSAGNAQVVLTLPPATGQNQENLDVEGLDALLEVATVSHQALRTIILKRVHS